MVEKIWFTRRSTEGHICDLLLQSIGGYEAAIECVFSKSAPEKVGLLTRNYEFVSEPYRIDISGGWHDLFTVRFQNRDAPITDFIVFKK